MTIEGATPKSATYTDEQAEAVLKGLETIAQSLKENPNEPLPHVALNNVNAATQLIVDAGGVIRSLVNQLAETQKRRPYIKVTSEASSKAFVDDTIQILNNLALDGLTPPKYKAVCDAVKLIHAVRDFDGVIYVVDWKSLALPKEGYLEMMRELEKLMLEEADRESSQATLLRNVFNTLVGQLRDNIAQESSNEELRGLIRQREDDLRSTREELQVALQKNESVSVGNIREWTQEPALLDKVQKGADQGFWLINREWHDETVRIHHIDITTASGRTNYLALLRAAVARTAMKVTEGLTLKDFANMGVIVEWDSHITAEANGDKGYGPVFCAGTVKLLPDVKEPAKPVEPLCAVPDKFDDSGLYQLNDEWRRWFITKHPGYADLDHLVNRNFMRTVLSTSIGRLLGITGKAPVVVVDWDAAVSIGNTYFAVPEHSPSTFKVALKNQ